MYSFLFLYLVFAWSKILVSVCSRRVTYRFFLEKMSGFSCFFSSHWCFKHQPHSCLDSTLSLVSVLQNINPAGGGLSWQRISANANPTPVFISIQLKVLIWRLNNTALLENKGPLRLLCKRQMCELRAAATALLQCLALLSALVCTNLELLILRSARPVWPWPFNPVAHTLQTTLSF